MMRKHISVTILAITVTTLTIGTLTPIFTKLAPYLPPRTDLFLHLLAHTVLSITALQLVPSTVPPEAICAASVSLALLLEFIQHFLDNRQAQLGDLAAGTVGSFAVFLTPKDGRFIRPSFAALAQYLSPEDDEEDDEHRVGSWAV